MLVILMIYLLRDVLLQKGLNDSEFIIRSQESGQTDQNVNNQMVIEITKNNSF